jgi:hypothetical protein
MRAANPVKRIRTCKRVSSRRSKSFGRSLTLQIALIRIDEHFAARGAPGGNFPASLVIGQLFIRTDMSIMGSGFVGAVSKPSALKGEEKEA